MRIGEVGSLMWSDIDFENKCIINFLDNLAYLYDCTLYEGNDIIKQFSLVKVDGHRAVLLIPKMNTMLVKRDEYLLIKLFNYNLKEMNSYMRQDYKFSINYIKIG